MPWEVGGVRDIVRVGSEGCRSEGCRSEGCRSEGCRSEDVGVRGTRYAP